MNVQGKKNQGKPGNVTYLQAINELVVYSGWDFISECCGWKSIVGHLLVAPLPILYSLQLMVECSNLISPHSTFHNVNGEMLLSSAPHLHVQYQQQTAYLV